MRYTEYKELITMSLYVSVKDEALVHRLREHCLDLPARAGTSTVLRRLIEHYLSLTAAEQARFEQPYTKPKEVQDANS